ncbi:MAG: DUF3558 family protein, partial [Chloroflexi bacterium]|nr:DUF3558 family protein [Chloroflexota bacterium]
MTERSGACLGHRSRGWRRQLSALAAVLLLVACGGTTPGSAPGTGAGGANGTSPTSAAGGGDSLGGNASGPCSLITEAEMEEIIGKMVNAPEVDGTGCTFNSIELDDLIAINVRLEQANGADFQGIEILFPEGTEVAGLGDRGYMSPDGSLLYFARNNRLYA